MSKSNFNAFETLLNPQSIAVLGASKEAHKIGGMLLSHILKYGYDGKIYPVNPSADYVLGQRSFRSLSEVPGEVDLALIVLRADSAVKAIHDCSTKKVKTAIVYSSGFSELGDKQGTELQEELSLTASKGGVRILGPNTIGVLNPSSKLYAHFVVFPEETALLPGNVGFITQSGALGGALVMRAIDSGISVSSWISTGNEADLDLADAMDYFVRDARTDVIVAYVESIKNGDKLKAVAAKAARSRKPIVIFKAGTSTEGKRAAKSHTGAVAVNDSVFDAFVSQYGLVRAERLTDTFDLAKALSAYPFRSSTPSSSFLGKSRVGVVSGSGAANIVLLDELANKRGSRAGVTIPPLSDKTQESIRKLLPSALARNPVDVGGSVLNSPSSFGDTFRTVLSDPEIDIGLMIIPGRSQVTGEVHAGKILECAKLGKPIIVVWLCSPNNIMAPIKLLEENGIPVFFDVEAAARVLAAMDYCKQFFESTRSRENRTYYERI